MKKIKFTLLLLLIIFGYIFIPARSETVFPDSILKDSISLFSDLKPVEIKGYRVYNTGALPIDDGYLYVTRKSGETLLGTVWRRFLCGENVRGLEIGELDSNFQEKNTPKTRYEKQEFLKGFPVQYIDARLLRIGQDIYMVYCKQASILNKKSSSKSLYRAGLQLAKLEKLNGKWEVVSDVKISFDGREEFYEKNLVKRDFEKNWMPFSENGELYFVYLMDPEHIVLKADLETGEAKIHSRVQNSFAQDPHELRGSTPAVFDKELGEWITLYHFVVPTVKDTGKEAPAYCVGGYTFSKDSPYKIIRKTKCSLIGDEFSNSRRKIVFPISLVRDGNDYLVFYGEDDKRNKVARVSRASLINSMEIVDKEYLNVQHDN